jgi:Flp pilus assembly pilin Flp
LFAVLDSRSAKRILTWASADRELKLERQMNKLMRFVKDESGVTAIEYGLIAAATGLTLVLVMPDLKAALEGIFNDINAGLGGGGGGGGGGSAPSSTPSSTP